MCAIIIHILLAIGLISWASVQLHQRLKNPSEYHYTTCVITKIHNYEGLQDENGGEAEQLKDITFAYGFSNNDWNQTGTYTSDRNDWNSKRGPGDIGTCLYTLNSDRSHIDDSGPLTVRNYLIHQDTAAMWMVLDDKYIWINYIIFFTIACLFTTCFAKYTASGPVGVAFLAMCGVWIFAFWVANWPLFIMASIVEGGFSGALSHGATVDDVYVNMTDCRIDYIVDTVYVRDKFSLVKYDVFTDNGTMMAIDISDATNPEYFELGSTQPCYKNIYTQQIVLRQTASVEWLKPPTARYPLIIGLSVVLITVLFALVKYYTT
eukprot:619422_1